MLYNLALYATSVSSSNEIRLVDRPFVGCRTKKKNTGWPPSAFFILNLNFLLGTLPRACECALLFDLLDVFFFRKVFIKSFGVNEIRTVRFYLCPFFFVLKVFRNW